MYNVRKIFISSLVAIISVCVHDARAADADVAKGIAATTYVDKALEAKANKADLAPVATSGSYNDLSDRPSVQTTEGYTQYSQVEYGNISSGSSGDGGQYPSLAAAKKIAQDAIKAEVKGDGMVDVDQASAGRDGVVISVNTVDVNNIPDGSDAFPARVGSVKTAIDDVKSQIGGKTDYSSQKFASSYTDAELKNLVPGTGMDTELYYPSVGLSKKISQSVVKTFVDDELMPAFEQVFTEVNNKEELANKAVGTEYGSPDLYQSMLSYDPVGVFASKDKYPSMYVASVMVNTATKDKQSKGTIQVGSASSNTTAQIWVE